MPTYLIADCAYCGYVWRVKGVDNEGNLLKGYRLPKSCPLCKKRFDAEWSRGQLETYKKTLKNYRELVAFLNEKNGRKK